MRPVGGILGDFTLDTIRKHIVSIQKAKKWEGHPPTPSIQETVSTTAIRGHGRVLTTFAVTAEYHKLAGEEHQKWYGCLWDEIT